LQQLKIRPIIGRLAEAASGMVPGMRIERQRRFPFRTGGRTEGLTQVGVATEYSLVPYSPGEVHLSRAAAVRFQSAPADPRMSPRPRDPEIAPDKSAGRWEGAHRIYTFHRRVATPARAATGLVIDIFV
jgi:hypothetical protein